MNVLCPLYAEAAFATRLTFSSFCVQRGGMGDTKVVSS